MENVVLTMIEICSSRELMLESVAWRSAVPLTLN